MVKKKNRKNNNSIKEGKKKRRLILPQEVWPKVFALLLWLLALILIFSFFDKAGIGGQYLLRGLVFLVGKTIYALPLILVLTGLFVFKTKYRHYFLPSLLALFLLILGVAGILAIREGGGHFGGILGFLLSLLPLKLFGPLVSQIIFLVIILVGGIILWHLFWRERERKVLVPVSQPEEKVLKVEEEYKLKPKKIFFSKIRIKKIKPELFESRQIKPEAVSSKEEKAGAKETKILPFPLDLLEAEKGKPNSGDTNKNTAIIKSTLENFEIPVEMTEVNVGPTVTQYTLKPAEGIKLSKITALNNNLALALAAHPIRMEAPIPGRSLVGIEVPNKERAQVRLRNLLEKSEFQESKSISTLLFVLGKDVAGIPVFTDLAKMPHLLVAGATGTGKTIFLNSLILNLLYKNSPETLRFILADPKRVEFSIYQEMPHLLGPVIFDADKTILALRWLILEMERRFRALSAVGARDITSYNKIVAGKASSDKAPEEKQKVMPYIVLIIDELADLMAAKGREIESAIVRLAQLSRAVGIHLIVATQRPSVEVLTGLIKANITSRITFQVATQVDSRTVLDMAGAEKLLGYGDMLFLSAQTPKPKRIQAAFVSDKEVKKVVNWLREREEYLIYNSLNSSLTEALSQEAAERDMEIREFSPSGKSDDVLYEEAKRVVIEARKASASLLQRRLSIGYARAARLLDILEERGVVGPAEGAKPRKVYGERLREKDQFDEFKPQQDNF